MLIVTRKPGQSIKIGPDIVVKIVRLQRGQISVGIEAPKNVKILRDDVEDHDAPTLQSQERQG